MSTSEIKIKDWPYSQNAHRLLGGKGIRKQNRNRLTDLEKWIYGCWGEGWRVGIGSLGWKVYTVYLKWTTNKYLLHSSGNSAQCYVAAWMVH